jgi:hypothetical protein
LKDGSNLIGERSQWSFASVIHLANAFAIDHHFKQNTKSRKRTKKIKKNQKKKRHFFNSKMSWLFVAASVALWHNAHAQTVNEVRFFRIVQMCTFE